MQFFLNFVNIGLAFVDHCCRLYRFKVSRTLHEARFQENVVSIMEEVLGYEEGTRWPSQYGDSPCRPPTQTHNIIVCIEE